MSEKNLPSELTAANPESLASPFMQNRELSWLTFDQRVLDQGTDPSVPLLERLNFISIFWSNLQEFFMVRVGSLHDLSFVNKHIVDNKSGLTPSQQLNAIYARCHELYPLQEKAFHQVNDELRKVGVNYVPFEDLNADQREFLHSYTEANISPFLAPQIINSRHPFPHLENGALYVVVHLAEIEKPPTLPAETSAKAEKGKKKKKKQAGGAEGVTLGLIPLPRQCKRVITLPGEGFCYTLLEEAIELYAREIFDMYKVKHTNVICITRNADLNTAEGLDEEAEDYRSYMKRILKKRGRLAPVRLESALPLSSRVADSLLERLGLTREQTFVTSVPLDLSYTWGLASFVPEPKRSQLVNPPFTPEWPHCFDKKRRILDQVMEKDVILSYPYESMDAFVQMLREAAEDPDVISIRITLYRLATISRLAEALIAAAENGKQVDALFELRARFDENNNIEWSQRFEEAGCNVTYGFRDYKVHSKICCITRQSSEGLTYITQLGTGNYNEKTARLYTDFSFITTDRKIGEDATLFFRNMMLENASEDYGTLWVAPLQIKPRIIEGIDEQIALAKAGKPCNLFFKTNSITDRDVIEKIAEASRAGVPCTLFVRGISCLVPGIKGHTENVRVVSIVGRLLEHSRIYMFGPADDPSSKLYLSSADLMTRNMEKRVEIAWPLQEERIRATVLNYITACMKDSVKLRELMPDSTYTDLGYFLKKKGGSPFDSQVFLIEDAKRDRNDDAGTLETPTPKAAPAVDPQPEPVAKPKAEAASKPQPATEKATCEAGGAKSPHVSDKPANHQDNSQASFAKAKPASASATQKKAPKAASSNVYGKPKAKTIRPIASRPAVPSPVSALSALGNALGKAAATGVSLLNRRRK